MVADQAYAPREVIVVGYDDTAFAAMNVFVVIEAVASDIAKSSGVVVVDLGAWGLGRIDDELQTMSVAHRAQCRHVGRLSEDVDCQYSARSWRDAALDTRSVDVESFAVDVREYGDAIPVQDTRGGGGHGPWCCDDFIAHDITLIF